MTKKWTQFTFCFTSMQVGIIWSSWTLLSATTNSTQQAYEIWKVVCSMNHTLLVGVEYDVCNIWFFAAQWALSVWWVVIWIGHNIYPCNQDWRQVITYYIKTGLERWWWREFVFINSCDLLVCVWWWSGTLNEISIGYQRRIPIFVQKGSGGWADRLDNTYLDGRREHDDTVKPIIWFETTKDLKILLDQYKVDIL